MASIELAARGYGGRQVPNTLVTPDAPADHAAICLPGYGYRPTMPALHYPMQYLAWQGAHSFSVGLAYDSDPDFVRAGPQERLERIAADSGAVFEALFKHRRFAKITVIGKSLGTLAMIQQLSARHELASAIAVWLTPPLHDEEFVGLLQHCPQRSLIVIGSADGGYDPAQVERLRLGGKSVVVLPGADHALEVKGDVRASIEAMRHMMDAVVDFLSADG
jgi:hypothetical protein